MNLTQLMTGQSAMIVKIDGDRRYLSRITSIGLNVGCKIEMLQNVKKKPLLICLKTLSFMTTAMAIR